MKESPGINLTCPKCNTVLLHVEGNVKTSPEQLQSLFKLKTCPKCRHQLTFGDLFKGAKDHVYTSPNLAPQVEKRVKEVS